MITPKVVLLVFVSGKIVLTGAKKRNDIYQAFNNITTDNVVRYFNSSMTEFDKFNSFKLKIVFLTNNNYSIPFVDSMRAVAVST
jgi:hypothetical protein